ncbi:MAG: 3-deoxy-D-manno-octulosonic acid transferase [Gemmatimonadales bacterium]
MKQLSSLYRVLVAAAVPVVPLLLRDPRQRTAHRARLDAPSQLEHWARGHRDPTRSLAWFHASSVGEGLQARAVIQAWRSRLPDMQLVYTHFSPSADAFAATINADWGGYLCYDRPGDVDRMLTAAAPDLLVFTKLDLWPTLAVRASERGTRVAMIAATVNAGSGRMRWPARQLAAPGYAAIDAAAAVAEPDAGRLGQLGCRVDRIVIAGDPRVDSVLQAVQDALPPSLAGFGGDRRNVMVAGSTWPADETVVLTAFAQVRERFPAARLIVAPHEPSEAHIQHLDAMARDMGLSGPVRFCNLTADGTPAIAIVDRVGMLAALYASGGMAYVGGGLGRKGIHSVLEPAAWSRPVIIGPRDRGSRDAALLAEAGALVRLPQSGSAAALARVWCSWLNDPAIPLAAGHAGRHALDGQRGAAKRTATLLQELITRVRSPAPG